MAENNGQADERSGDVPLLDFIAGAVAGHFQALASDRSVAAMGREMVKDVRDTIHQVFFGQHEGGGEIGAPLNPLASEIANDDVLHFMAGQDGKESLPSPSEIAGNPYGNAQSQDRGGAFQQADRSWVDYILNRGKDETPYNPDKQHIKPEDEKEQKQEGNEEEKENDRDNGGRGGRC